MLKAQEVEKAVTSYWPRTLPTAQLTECLFLSSLINIVEHEVEQSFTASTVWLKV
jgi:hypothetical protein